MDEILNLIESVSEGFPSYSFILEFATFNNLVLTNTFGPHKPSRRWTWHSPDEKYHNQIDYILVKKCFRSGVNIHRTRSFPDIGSDHDLVMMTFRVRLKRARKPNQPRLRSDLEKLRDPDLACTFQATIGGKFASPIGLSDEDMDIDTMITDHLYNTTVTDAASKILGKERRRKKPGVIKDVLDLCDERRDLKKKRYEAEGAKEYREAKKEDSEGSEESKGGLDRCSARGD